MTANEAESTPVSAANPLSRSSLLTCNKSRLNSQVYQSFYDIVHFLKPCVPFL